MPKRPMQSVKSLFRYKAFLIVNVVVLVLLALSFGREFVRSAAIKKEIAMLESERASLEESNFSLETYQDYLQSEAFLEREAREKFGLQKPGETQVYITDEEVSGVQIVTHEAEVEEVSNARLWSWYFFNSDRFEAYVAEK